MKNGTTLLACAACCALWTSSVAAQPAHNDVQCLLVSNLFAQSGKDAKAKTVGQAGAFFYLGRVDGRMSADRLKAAVQEQQKTLKAANAAAIMTRCARRMETSVRSIQSTTGKWVRQK
jgi:hypothetical protein